MALIESLLVRLGLQTANFDANAKKVVQQNRQMQSSFGSLGTSLAGAAAGFFTLQRTFGFFKTGFEEAREGTRETAKLVAVLNATGHAAGFSAQELSGYADALSLQTAVEDQVIRSGQAVLATFRNIQGEAFMGATQAALDMSAVMGQDLQSSMVQIGKALNDPTEGLKALTRVGVTFTDGQVAMIAKMQEAGDMMGAQKVILAELAAEFGRAAAAMATDTDKMVTAFGEVREASGAFFASWLNDTKGGANSPAGEFSKMLNDAAFGMEVFRQMLFGPDTFPEAPAVATPIDPAAEKRQQAILDATKLIGEYNDALATAGMSAEEIAIHELEVAGAQEEQLDRLRELAAAREEVLEIQRQELEAKKEALRADQEAADLMLKRRDDFAKQEEQDAERQWQEQQRMADQFFNRTRTDMEKLAIEGANAISLFDSGFIDEDTLGRLSEQMTEQIRGMAADEVGEVRFAGATEAGSQEAFSNLAKFQGQASQEGSVKEVQQKMLRELEELVRIERERQENEQVIAAF